MVYISSCLAIICFKNIISIDFQMTLFVTKLNGSPIGVTVGKMFVADKSAILTVTQLPNIQ